MSNNNELIDVFQSVLGSLSDALSTKRLIQAEKPYIEAIFKGLNEDNASISVYFEDINKTFELPLEFYDGAYIPRYGAHLMIFSQENDGHESQLKIIAVNPDGQAVPFATHYQLIPTKLSIDENCVFRHPVLGRIYASPSENMQNIISSGLILENTPIMMKIVQAGENFFLSPLLDIDNTETDNNNKIESNYIDYVKKIMDI